MKIIALLCSLFLWYDPSPGSSTGVGEGTSGGNTIEECKAKAESILDEKIEIWTFTPGQKEPEVRSKTKREIGWQYHCIP